MSLNHIKAPTYFSYRIYSLCALLLESNATRFARLQREMALDLVDFIAQHQVCVCVVCF